MSSVNHFEYPDLALTIDRGIVGQPSTVTLDWVANMADGRDVECNLVLDCTLKLNASSNCRELTVISVRGDDEAVTEFGLWSTRHRSMVEIDETKTWLEDERMDDTAIALGRTMLMPDMHNQYPRLMVKVVQ